VRENARTKAQRYLSEGRVIIESVTGDEVRARVRGDGAIYTSGYSAGVWSCDCPALSDGCCHLKALRLISAIDIERTP
jgi:uncharacterized Zn finger protein